MASLLIVRPVTPAATNSGFALTPNPKEGVSIAANTTSIFAYDFGTPAPSIDFAYVGYHSAAVGGGSSFTVAQSASYGGANTTTLANAVSMAPLGLGYPNHSIARFAPQSSRYLNLSIAAGSSAITVGVIMLGLTFQPTYGHEYGSGRLITDTGSAERLFGGGFGIYEGERAGGWQWTLGDLTDAEVRTLYQLAKDRGATRSVLVVEDPDLTDGLNERIHWGLFSKLDAYERFAPNATRWSLRIDDWA